jgi:6-phosphogluconolactonase (cycloisomerase 2 family)
MKSTIRRTAVTAAAIGSVTAATMAFLPGTGQAATQAPTGARPPYDRTAAEVFVQTDALSGNAIAVYDAAGDGTLRAAATYPTGGLGGQLTGSVIDHQASQGSLAYDGEHRLLYAVNAGSNTITVFSSGNGKLIRRQVISSGGTFPVSVAVRGNLVYVLNARDGGSVQGFLRIGDTLVSVPAWHRGLGLDPTATPEFTHTPGQVAFTPDGSKLIVTTKGNGNDIDVFRVGMLGPSRTPVVNADPGNVPFAVTFDSAGHLIVAEAGPNAVANFTVKADGTLSLIDRVATGQAGTCWVARDGAAVYASNAGSGTVSAYGDDGRGTLRSIGTAATDAGTTDATSSADGRYVYVETGANGIVDEYHVNTVGSLTEIGSVTVPGAAGGEGIAASLSHARLSGGGEVKRRRPMAVPRSCGRRRPGGLSSRRISRCSAGGRYGDRRWRVESALEFFQPGERFRERPKRNRAQTGCDGVVGGAERPGDGVPLGRVGGERLVKVAVPAGLDRVRDEFGVAECVGDPAGDERVFVVPGVAGERPARPRGDTEERGQVAGSPYWLCRRGAGQEFHHGGL